MPSSSSSISSFNGHRPGRGSLRDQVDDEVQDDPGAFVVFLSMES